MRLTDWTVERYNIKQYNDHWLLDCMTCEKKADSGFQRQIPLLSGRRPLICFYSIAKKGVFGPP